MIIVSINTKKGTRKSLFFIRRNRLLVTVNDSSPGGVAIMKVNRVSSGMGLAIAAILFLLISCTVHGCKDTEATHVAGLLETCKGLLDERNWADAIDACEEVETDEGRHLAALAYMGRSDLTMATLLVELSDGSTTPTSLIFSKIPDTDQKVSDFKKALNLLMGEIEDKNQTIYIESVLLSSLLIFKELKTLLGLSLVSGEMKTCAGDPADITGCAFTPEITIENSIPKTLLFEGLGADFYEGLCRDITSDTDIASSKTDTTTTIENLTIGGGGDYTPGTYDITHNVTVYGAAIGKGSALYYNKVASSEYAKVGSEDLSSLSFYHQLDNGENFSITLSPLPNAKFCNSGVIDPPDASDDVLSDCEILSFFENPGF